MCLNASSNAMKSRSIQKFKPSHIGNWLGLVICTANRWILEWIQETKTRLEEARQRLKSTKEELEAVKRNAETVIGKQRVSRIYNPQSASCI